MAEGAHVTSVDAIEAFRSALLVYVSKARPTLEDAFDDVSRTREWLRQDRRVHWEAEVRRRTKILHEAKQALFSSELANLREPRSAEIQAVHRAKRLLVQAEDKLRLIKKWSMEFDNHVGPSLKQLEHLRTLLAGDLPKAAILLRQIVTKLDNYTGTKMEGNGASRRAVVDPPTEELSMAQPKAEETV